MYPGDSSFFTSVDVNELVIDLCEGSSSIFLNNVFASTRVEMCASIIELSNFIVAQDGTVILSGREDILFHVSNPFLGSFTFESEIIELEGDVSSFSICYCLVTFLLVRLQHNRATKRYFWTMWKLRKLRFGSARAGCVFR